MYHLVPISGLSHWPTYPVLLFHRSWLSFFPNLHLLLYPIPRIVLLFCSSFSRQVLWLLTWDSSFLTLEFNVIIFYLSTALPASHKFCLIVCCVFIFIYLKVFHKLLLISSVTLWLFRSVLFDFHVFVNVPKFFLLLISDSIVVRDHTLCYFCYFKWTEVCFVA